jgi:FG-GAP repeat
LGLLLTAALAPTAAHALSFSGPTNFAAGTAPTSVAVADFNRDGKPDLAVANQGSNDVSILLNTTPGYQRPRGATPFLTYLVPAYKACASPNRTHGTPLAFPSCNPPVQTSHFLTVGTPDANGAGSRSIGRVLFRVTAGDVLINANITDVRCQSPQTTTTCGDANAANDSAGPDYTGQVQVAANLRITDQDNGSSGTDPATGDVPLLGSSFPVAASCAETPLNKAVGATCTLATSANALRPGAVQAGQRANWELGRVQVYDGGASGVAGAADATLFEEQGVFVP